jgi:hypothetical protein
MGVDNLGDFAVQLRAKMMTLPGERPRRRARVQTDPRERGFAAAFCCHAVTGVCFFRVSDKSE